MQLPTLSLFKTREVLEIFLLLELLHSLLATCGLLLGCQTPPSRTCGFATSLINGCGSFWLLLRITAAPWLSAAPALWSAGLPHSTGRFL